MRELEFRDIVNKYQSVVVDSCVVIPSSISSRKTIDEHRSQIEDGFREPSNLLISPSIYNELRINLNGRGKFTKNLAIGALLRGNEHQGEDLAKVIEYLQPIGEIKGLFENGHQNGSNDLEIASLAFCESRFRRTAFLSGDEKLVDLVEDVRESVVSDGFDDFPIEVGELDVFYFNQGRARFSKYIWDNVY